MPEIEKHIEKSKISLKSWASNYDIFGMLFLFLAFFEI